VHAIRPSEVERRIPILRPGYVAWAMIDPNAMDVDVPSLQAAYLDGFRQRNCRIVTGADVIGIHRTGGQWQVETATAGRFDCDILVNAAGAWADQVGEMAGLSPLGLVPRCRTAIRIDTPAGADTSAWPMIEDASREFFFKPQHGSLVISPSDILPSPPIDAQPEDVAVSTAITRFQRATTVTVGPVRQAWAGLRTFASDQIPVTGADERADGFVWLAAQGGCGIQAAPALAQITAAAVLGLPFPPHLAALGLTAAALGPERLRS
jgi:D-arginine dehydrogenase